jgi:hypothetical protein
MHPGKLQVRQHLCQLGPDQRAIRRHLPTSKHPTFTSYRMIDRQPSFPVLAHCGAKQDHRRSEWWVKAAKIAGMTTVYLEVGKKRVFAAAVDWPGWCRAGKTEELALEVLADYHPRYAVVARQARIAFPRKLADDFEIVERVAGSGATDFGVPEHIPQCLTTAVSAAEAKRLTRLVRAAWTIFDQVAAGAPAELRKGPRGGGRDRDKMIDHVVEAETSYARMLGIKPSAAERRDAIAAVLSAPSGGAPLAGKKWTQRYAASRIAWHVLDHAWEMQDKST